MVGKKEVRKRRKRPQRDISWLEEVEEEKKVRKKKQREIEINNTKPVKEVIFLNGEILKILKENKYT